MIFFQPRKKNASIKDRNPKRGHQRKTGRKCLRNDGNPSFSGDTECFVYLLNALLDPPHLPLYLLHYLALYPRTAPTAVCMCTYCCTRFLLLLKFHRIIYVLFCVRTDEDIPGESDILSPGETTILYPRENWCKRVLHVVPGTYYCYLL